MGIRIRKAMGYGTYVTIEELKNVRSVLANENVNIDMVLDRGKIKYADKTDDFDVCMLYNNIKSLNFDCLNEPIYTCVEIVNDEFTNKGPVIIVPPTSIDHWIRYDDDIDYVEVVQRNIHPEDFAGDIRWYSNPLYPFNDWMDANTGDRLPYDFTYCAQSEALKALYEEKNGSVNAIPMVPYSVRSIADYINLNYLNLRPVVATWWS